MAKRGRGRPKGLILKNKVSVRFDKETYRKLNELTVETFSTPADICRQGLALHKNGNLPLHKLHKGFECDEFFVVCLSNVHYAVLKKICENQKTTMMSVMRSGVNHLYDKLIEEKELPYEVSYKHPDA